MNQFCIGKNIQRFRLFKGKKQETFAKEIGISRVMLSRYENGRSSVSLQKLCEIAKILEVELSELTQEFSVVSPIASTNNSIN
jgi:transcriptional regulator with XRE-family HTH domain